ncbi:MAG: cation:proton antiporter [Betaproteobacteria bacterium]|nr:cation:proton antiporter [Betaproteobacteria bacterium]
MNPNAALALLAAAVLLVPLFKRLGLGPVLGYLVAGVVIGPWALGVVTEPDTMLHTAELGVTLLMFLIGLELQPSRLWALRQQVFGLGLLQEGATALVVALIGVALGLPWAAAAVVGVAIAMSSTAFILPLLAERKELTTRQGREAFAILLFQDVSVIPILALLAVAGGGAAKPPGWPAAAAIAVLAFAGRPALATMFRYVARFGGSSRELFAAAALLAAVGIALLMNAVGLSASLGAFLAGVLLADSEFRHELEASIEPFESLLLGLFFMAVGMGINIGLIRAQPGLVVALGAGILLLKMTVLYAARRALGAPDAVARPLAVTLATGGEFAFVLFGVAAGGGLISAAQSELLTVGVALSMAFAPFLFMAHDKIVKPWIDARHAPPFSPIDDPGKTVVIAGFGRVGQVVGRLLNARGIEFTALDSSPEQVDVIRKFGNKIYYGDASKLSLLHAAKAGEARLFVLAVDDVEVSMKIAELVRQHFPEVPVLARARNRNHLLRLRDIGVQHVMRETFWSSVEMGRIALRELGHTDGLGKLIDVFVKHDHDLLDAQQAVFRDQAAMIATSKNARAELANILENELRQKSDT